MEDRIFEISEELWNKTKTELGRSWNLMVYAKELLEAISKEERAIKELKLFLFKV